MADPSAVRGRAVRHCMASILEGKKLVCAFGAAVCNLQARKHYIDSLLTISIKEAVSFEAVQPLYSCLFIAHLIDIWKPSILSMVTA